MRKTDTGLRDIEYRTGHKLQLEPVGSSIENVAQRLLDGKTVHVMLEPGDATLYDFYLIPFWGEDMRPRYINKADSLKYMMLALHNLDQKTATVAFSRDENEVYWTVAEGIQQEWTCQLLSCFVLHVADKAAEIAQRKQAAFQRFNEIVKPEDHSNDDLNLPPTY